MNEIKVVENDVLCKICGEHLDRVPGDRTALCRAGEYGKHECRLICYGAGTTGRIIARNNPGRVLCFADSDEKKWGMEMEGVKVGSPSGVALAYPDATWIASAIIPDYHREISEEIAKLGVKTIPVWGFLPQRTTPPSEKVGRELLDLVAHDMESFREVCDQIDLRSKPQSHQQRPPSDIREIYFPDFIVHRDDERYVDCGAADGDTVREFLKRWDKWSLITAVEPDEKNFGKILEDHTMNFHMQLYRCAVSDHRHTQTFQSTGDYSARLTGVGRGNASVMCETLDDLVQAPTYIKMDIEGSELEALWGARRILKEHSPVLAICAYHEASHFWEIPLLIHALQPEYKLFFRRYAQGSFEIIWYAVPPDRVRA